MYEITDEVRNKCYYPGDIVHVIPWKVAAKYGFNSYNWHFVLDMFNYCDQDLVVKKDLDGWIAIEGNDYSWSSEMFIESYQVEDPDPDPNQISFF